MENIKTVHDEDLWLVSITARLHLQNICILIIGVLNILNHFLPGRYLDLSIKLADHYKLPALLVVSVLLHGGLSAYCRLQDKCIELFVKEITFVFFSCAITMKVSVIIDTLLRRNGIIQRCRKMSRKSNRVDTADSPAPSPAVRYTAEHSDSNIVSIEFQPSQPEENIERPVSCQSQSRSQSQAYWGMKQHIVSFRTRLVQSRSEITTLYHKDKAQDSLLGAFLAFRCVFMAIIWKDLL